MKVFDVIPKGFFSILSGKNREIYSEMLLVVRQEYKRSTHVDKNILLDQMVDRLSELNLLMDVEAEILEISGTAEDDREAAKNTDDNGWLDDSDGLSFSGMAYAVLRRLLFTGWLEQEQKAGSFDLQITIPSYSISMMELLYEVTQEDTRAYQNYAFGVYSALRSMFDPQSENYLYTALHNAWDNSQQLADALKMLLNNIRRYHRMLGEYASSNEILREHFEGYQQLVNERIFHPLVTRDSVQRFRQPVLLMISQIQDDYAIIEKMVQQAAADKHYNNEAEATTGVLQMLHEIFDIFDNIEEVMMEIQKKNNSYTKASIDKLIYLFNQDRTIKEQIAHILMQFHQLSEASKTDLSESIRLSRQAYFAESSLFSRGKRTLRSTEKPLKIEISEKNDLDLTGFLKSANTRYSHEKVMYYVEQVFAGRSIIHSEDFPAETDEQFVLLLLAVIKGSEARSFYRVEFLEGMIETGKFRYPDMRFFMKEIKK